MDRSALAAVLAAAVLLSAALVPIAAGATSSSPVVDAIDATDAANVTDAVDDEDDFPRVSAGLDQTVQRNASVLLDGTESFSPDGELTAYIWQIESPSGDRVSASCDRSDCGLARFRAPELGEYSVTLYVEDDQGQRESDTLYVQVVPRGEFGVELAPGPNATRGQVGNLTATIAPGSKQVQRLAWFQESRLLAVQNVSALGGRYNRSTYVAPGTEYRAVAIPRYGLNASDSWQATSSPDGWQWLGGSDGPRIVGPAVVTGDPDGTGWRKTGVPYAVRGADRAAVSEAVWTLNGQQIDSNQRSIDVGLPAGSSDLQAELPAGDTYRQEYVHGQANRSAYARGAETLSTSVIYDPAPEFGDGVELASSAESIVLRTRFLDAYNGIERIQLSVGRSAVTRTSAVDSGRYTGTFGIPQYEHGETSVTVEIIDGRGQRDSYTERLTLPQPDPVALSEAPMEVLSSYDYNDGGTSPVARP